MKNLLKNAINITVGYENIETMRRKGTVKELDPIWPRSCKESIRLLSSDKIDIEDSIINSNFQSPWLPTFYKAWLYFRRTYVLTSEQFENYAKSKLVRVYPSKIETLPVDIFAINVSGKSLFNGYVLFAFDVTDEGVICTLYIYNEYDQPDKHGKLVTKTLGKPLVFILSKDGMKTDEEGKEYYELDLNGEDEKNQWFFISKAILGFIEDLAEDKILAEKSPDTIREIKRAEKLDKSEGRIEYKYNIRERD